MSDRFEKGHVNFVDKGLCVVLTIFRLEGTGPESKYVPMCPLPNVTHKDMDELACQGADNTRTECIFRWTACFGLVLLFFVTVWSGSAVGRLILTLSWVLSVMAAPSTRITWEIHMIIFLNILVAPVLFVFGLGGKSGQLRALSLSSQRVKCPRKK